MAAATAAAGHGRKETIYVEACRALGLSRATLLRRLKEVSVKPPRKTRSDAGKTHVSRDEAILLSAALMATLRKSATKRLLSVPDAIELMRCQRRSPPRADQPGYW